MELEHEQLGVKPVAAITAILAISFGLATSSAAGQSQVSQGVKRTAANGGIQITAVTPIYPINGSAGSQQYIIIQGSGFGSTPAQTTPLGDGSVDTVACHATSTPSLAIDDNGGGDEDWSAGRMTCRNQDAIGVDLNANGNPPFWWSDNLIVLWGFGSALDGVNYVIDKGDPLVVRIFGPGNKTTTHFNLRVTSPNPKRQSGDTLVVIQGNQGMIDTGISVQSGQSVSINAAGLVTIATDGRPPFSPAGFLADCSVYSPGGNGFPSPTLSCESLIGQIGSNGAYFEVGAHQAFTANASGELYLGINDNNLGDNSGSWKASVLVQ